SVTLYDYIFDDSLLINSCISIYFSIRRRHTRFKCDRSSDVCSSDLDTPASRSGRHESIQQKQTAAPDPAYARHRDVAIELHGGKIGRASCRERGWEGGWGEGEG